jgi:tRNA-2-methylthio-N6-dimethylallyladenosine synthase
MGRTANNRIVNFAAGADPGRLVGRMVDVAITHAYTHSLRGSAISADEVDKNPAE